MISHFSLLEDEPDECTAVLRVAGELHVSTAPEFSQRLHAAVARGRSGIVVDLSEVTFIDSTGLSVLLNALRRQTRRGGRMVLVCTNPTVLRLFAVTRLDATFDIRADLDDALARVRV